MGLGLSSLGDWLGLLALTAMANQLADGYASRNYAIAGVLLLRVLRPGGVVGLVWNTRDDAVPRVAALQRLLADEARGHEADQGVVDAFARALPARVDHSRSGFVQRLDPGQVVAGIATRSYVAMMDGVRREEFLGEVRALLATHPGTRGRDVLDLPYRTDAYRLTPA